MGLAHVTSPQCSAEAVLGVVGDAHSFFLARDLHRGKHWSKDLFLLDPHAGLHVLEDRRRNEDAALDRLDGRSTSVNSGAFLLTDLDVLIHTIELRTVDDGAHCRRRVVGVTRHDRLRDFTHLVEQLILDLLIDEDARTGVTGLTCVVEHSPRNGRGGGIHVWAVRQHDVWCLAAQLERDRLGVALCGVLEEVLTDLGGAGEGELLHVHVLAERTARGWSKTWDHVQHAIGQTCLRAEFGEQQCRQRRLFGRLQHHGVACGKCCANLPRGDDQWIVPRHYCANHTHRLSFDHRHRVTRNRRDLAVQLVDRLAVPLNVVRARGNVHVQ